MSLFSFNACAGEKKGTEEQAPDGKILNLRYIYHKMHALGKYVYFVQYVCIVHAECCSWYIL